MIIDIILVIIGLIGLILATLNDIKHKEVPDFISYSLIAIGLSLRLIYLLTYKQYSYFLYALLYGAIFFGLGSIMYYTKQWGGGDTKLFERQALHAHNIQFVFNEEPLTFTAKLPADMQTLLIALPKLDLK